MGPETASIENDRDFERAVRQIAQALWPNFTQEGPIVLEERERDGVFITEETINIIEATTSRRQDKAKQDIQKSVALARRLRSRYPGRAVRIWFITQDEPTADQNKIAEKINEFTVLTRSYHTFRAQLFDVHTYRTARRNYPFGSARDLRSNNYVMDNSAYVEMGLLSRTDQQPYTISKLSSDIGRGAIRRVVLLGDYGTGKSMTMRQIYLELDNAFQRQQINRFPIFLNLRDHSNQTDPVEVLERHARLLGIGERASHLVRAWRAGYTVLLLDGFDELSSAGWLQFNRQLRQIRYSTVEVIRRFIIDTPPDTPIIIAGRGSYFDSEEECLRAFGISTFQPVVLTLNEFNEEQIRSFLSKYEFRGVVPDWMPVRPLLLGYLLVRRFLNSDLTAHAVSPGKGWHMLLDQICAREATTHAHVDANTIRSILEWLGSLARAKGTITSPFSPADLTEAFRVVVGIEPDQAAETLLLRLPGLASGFGLGQEQRAFIDEDLANAAAGGDVAKFILNPFQPPTPTLLKTIECLSDVGLQVCAAHLQDKDIPEAQLGVAERKALELGQGEPPSHALAFDVFRVANELDFSVAEDSQFSILRQVFVESLDLTDIEANYSHVVFRECVFRNVYLSPEMRHDNLLPHFEDCEIEYLDGRSSANDLPKDKFKETKCNQFGGAFSTTAAVLATDLSDHIKVLLITLRKLFVQKGAGRKKSSFFRGMPEKNHALVSEILALLRKHEFAYPTHKGKEEEIWSPNRKMGARVNAILQAPTTSKDALIEELRRSK